jgi:hypothetical protein
MVVAVDCEDERDVDPVVPETFAERDDINTDDDNEVLSMVSLLEDK